MKPKRLLLLLLCLLLAIAPFACSPAPASEEPQDTNPILPTRTLRPPRPTRTPLSGGGALQPASPQPPQPTTVPTKAPQIDPASSLFQMDIASLGTLFDDPYMTLYGEALVVPVVVNGAKRLHVVNFAEGWEAEFPYPLEFMVPNYALAVLADGILLADFSAEGFSLWKLAADDSAVMLGRVQETEMWITSIAFAPEGKTLAVGCFNGDVRLYRGSDGALQRTIKAHNDNVLSLAWSWDGRTLLTDSLSFDPNTYAWNANTGARLATLSSESWNMSPPAISPDGKWAAGVSEDGTRIFSTSGWQPTGTYLQMVWDTKFSCDSSEMMLDSRGEAQFYSLETGELLETITTGNWLYCTSDGQTVILEGYETGSTLNVRIVRP